MARLLLVLAGLACGCGARTALEEGSGAGDAGPDPLRVDCILPEGEYTAPGNAIRLEARAQGGANPIFDGWVVTLAPEGSLAEPSPADAPVTTLTAELVGGYRLRATFHDGSTEESCLAEIQVVAGPTVDCSDDEITTPAGSSVVLSVDAAGAEPLTYRWVVQERPLGSTATPDPEADPTTRFRPDVAGAYQIGAQVQDRFGVTGACTIRIIATPDPPRLECDDVDTEPLQAVPLVARYLGEGNAAAWTWALVGAPEGSSADPPQPSDGDSPQFTPDLAGDYVVEVVVRNDRGEEFACALTVHAFPMEALRIEMFWNPPDRSCDDGGGDGCDDSDLDLHLLHEDGDAWFNATWDCHWRNCERGLAWDAAGEDDDAFLDLDDVEGFGPENINVQAPADGTFRIGAHYYDPDRNWDSPSDATVRVYCGDEEPVELTRTLVAAGEDDPDNDFWKVADVSFSSGRCSITELGEVVTALEARNRR